MLDLPPASSFYLQSDRDEEEEEGRLPMLRLREGVAMKTMYLNGNLGRRHLPFPFLSPCSNEISPRHGILPHAFLRSFSRTARR